MKLRLIILLFIAGLKGTGQVTPRIQKQVDSIQQVIQTAGHDTIVVNAIKKWSDLIYTTNTVVDFELMQRIEKISAKNLKKKLTPGEKKFFLKSKSYALNNIGLYHYLNVDYIKAIECHTKALKIREQTGDKQGTAASLNNIGLIYDDQGNIDKAIEYYTRSLKIDEEVNDSLGISNSLGNLGNVYYAKKDYEKSLQFHMRGLRLKEKLHDTEGIGASLNNIGNIYLIQGDLEKAMDNYTQSLAIKHKINDIRGQSDSYNNIGIVYFERGDLDKSIHNSKRALQLVEHRGYIPEIKNAALQLYQVYKKKGDYSNALKMHELYIRARDSILREENHKAIMLQEYKYQYEKQALADSVRHLEEQKIKDARLAGEKALARKQQVDLKNKRFQQYVLFGGL
ncbi:MAG TPA: tetratricopeptide repeat protein, partial [Flavobacteriales bacterium]|nr:tetratricopeptide repeat protein [Flavobacteriales bacterium]